MNHNLRRQGPDFGDLIILWSFWIIKILFLCLIWFVAFHFIAKYW